MIKFTSEQIEGIKKLLRKKIFYLLLIVDPETSKQEQYMGVDVDAAFENLLSDLDGFNEIFSKSVEMVTISGKLAKAYKGYKSSNFNFKKYRKLILDAGSEVIKMGGG